MKLVEAILSVLRAAQPFYSDPVPETELERDIRLTQAAIAITAASSKRYDGWPTGRMAGSLLALGKAESNWARYVWAGKCMQGPVGMQCDPHKGKAQARTYWQLHRNACPAAWRKEPGSTAEVQAAANCAARLLASSGQRCKRRNPDILAGAFAGYRGIDCSWRGGLRRAVSSRRLTGRVHGFLSSP